ncbi:hypothetical protein H0A36_17005 [Endozoicomonas sp. SM1973]|uniref:Uncharacterized protein n=1 Tax=Spartinivicinus marinus TaxID=2994442 RepID=A0A853ICB4_9GAMM|nr:hypothetical protein [Spartinivicinus marinus]MCX4029094.1 hypothetical protein [Spartinivicinus marinus]NYZ67714.1 hypothetical protein [Spartinivicinus marinus]
MSLFIHIVWLLLSLVTFSTAARDYSQMYSQETLQQAHQVYTPNVHGMLFSDIAGFLTNNELTSLRRVNLLQPWYRANDPFEFASNPVTGDLLAPTLSVKFLDDLAIAVVWFERFHCDKKIVFDYIAALDFSHLKLPTPLQALGIPTNAYKLDHFVDDVSQKILKSALTFIILHELGHIHYRHRPYHTINSEQAIAQEIQADHFAINILRRMRLPPTGMVVWFMATSMRDPLKEGSPQQTHPLTGQRLQAIVDALRLNPNDFIEPANKATMTARDIRQLANEIETIANGLANPKLRSLLQKRGSEITLLPLANNCKKPTKK